MSEYLSNFLAPRLLQVAVFNGILITGGSTEVFMNPSSSKQLFPGQNLKISVSSDLTSIDSSILCRFSRQLGCPNDAKYEDLFNSYWDFVTNGTSQRYLRFFVSKRSHLDFEILIIGVQIEDEGCYICQEIDENGDDSKSFNLTVKNCNSSGQCVQINLATPAPADSNLTATTEHLRYPVNGTTSETNLGNMKVSDGSNTTLIVGLVLGIGSGLTVIILILFLIRFIIKKRNGYQRTTNEAQ